MNKQAKPEGKIEKIVLNEQRDVSLTAYIQDVGGSFGFTKRPGMLVLPGGGYNVCSERESDAVAAILVYPAILKDICDYCQLGMP